MKVKFDGTINLGHILTAVSILVGGFMVYSSIRSTIDQHELRITSLEKNAIASQQTIQLIFTKLNEIAVDVGVIKGRMDRDAGDPR